MLKSDFLLHTPDKTCGNLQESASHQFGIEPILRLSS